MILPIGKLDRQITIEQVTQGEGPYGEPTETWAPFAAGIWANAYASGREFVAARQVNAEITIMFQIRWRTGISTTMRILYEGTYFDIVGPPIEVGRRERLNIFAKARQV